jgi:vacuolar-type H+-ATPase subunit H
MTSIVEDLVSFEQSQEKRVEEFKAECAKKLAQARLDSDTRIIKRKSELEQELNSAIKAAKEKAFSDIKPKSIQILNSDVKKLVLHV